MKPRDFLNLKNISGQIAALVIASIIAIHLIMAAIFLVSRPDQPDPTVDRRHAQFTAAVQLLGAAPADDRPRLIADIARAFPQLAVKAFRRVPFPPRAIRKVLTCGTCIDGSTAAIGFSRSRTTRTATTSASRCRTAP